MTEKSYKNDLKRKRTPADARKVRLQTPDSAGSWNREFAKFCFHIKTYVSNLSQIHDFIPITSFYNYAPMRKKIDNNEF